MTGTKPGQVKFLTTGPVQDVRGNGDKNFGTKYGDKYALVTGQLVNGKVVNGQLTNQQIQPQHFDRISNAIFE